MNKTVPAHGLSEAQLGKILDVLAPFAGRIERVDLFGSRARGAARPDSDIDMVIYGADADEALADRLWTLFNDSSLPLKVDIAAYSAVRYAPLKQRIGGAGRTLFTQDDLRAYAARL